MQLYAAFLGLVFAISRAQGIEDSAADYGLQPQPRQIFREGLEGNDRPFRHRRRPSSSLGSHQEMRDRQHLSIADLPLGPRPGYDNANFKPSAEIEHHAPDAVQFDEGDDSTRQEKKDYNSKSLKPFTPSGAEQGSSDDNEDTNEFEEEELTSHLSEYKPSQEPFHTDDSEDTNEPPNFNLIEPEEENDVEGLKQRRNEETRESYRGEIRSPAHRYPDDEENHFETTHEEMESSSTTPAFHLVTPIPLPDGPFERFDEDLAVKQSKKFERSPGRFASSTTAEDRNFETRSIPSRFVVGVT